MPFSPTGSSSRRVIRLRAHGERTGGESTAQGKASGIKKQHPCGAVFLPEPSGLALSLRGPSVTFAARTGEHAGRRTDSLSSFRLPFIRIFRPYLSYFTPQALGFSCCIGNMQRHPPNNFAASAEYPDILPPESFGPFPGPASATVPGMTGHRNRLCSLPGL